ncbi:MAG: putative RNA methyltransferase [Emergencia sp.]
MMNKADKFYDIKNFLQCPVCGRKIRFHAGGLVCKKEHRFDISSKGYVNLLRSARTLKGYDADFFESRRRFFAAGYYDHVAEAVVELALKEAEPVRNLTGENAGRGMPGDPAADRSPVFLDAGCGEGFYSAALSRALREQNLDGQIIAFDIAAEAVKTAARGPEQVKWMVADITRIPVKDKAADVILDIFTPANYSEFERVLTDQGTVIKVIPGAEHMGQLRRAASPFLRHGTYSNEDVLDGFLERFELMERRKVTRTCPLNEGNLQDLAGMTPLLFGVDKTLLDLSSLKEITVEAEILAGRKKRGIR